MAEILCLSCTEVVSFGNACKCFFYTNNIKNNSQKSLKEIEKRNKKIDDTNTEFTDHSNDNSEKLCPEFQQFHNEVYTQMDSLENEKTEEILLIPDLNEKKISSWFDEISPNEQFLNQYRHLYSTLNEYGTSHLDFTSNCCDNEVHSEEFPFSTASTENFKIDKESGKDRDKRYQMNPSIFYNQSSCETDTSTSIYVSPNNECDRSFEKIKWLALSQDEMSSTYPYKIIKKTRLNDKNTIVTTNVPVNSDQMSRKKESYKNVFENVEHPTDSSMLYDVVTKRLLESVSKVEKPIESIKDANTELGPSNMQSNLIRVKNRQPSHVNFSFGSKLDNHQQTYICEKSYDCDICKKVFDQKSHLNVHYRTHSIDMRFVCDVCEKIFKRKYDLVVHYRKHTGEKPYGCDICKKRFSVKCRLDTHYRIHTNEKPFVCDICKKGFSQKSNLIVHHQTHSNDKPFACDTCEKTFHRNFDLEVHYRTHTNKKQYGCDICKKRFTRKSILRYHYRIHTNEKPFMCHICEKRFVQKYSLVVHFRSHTGERPYGCDICKKRFSVKSSLNYHYRIHANEKTFVCDM